MRRALLLVDLQRDFLSAPTLEPAAGAVVARAATLLEAWRRRGLPVVHAWTTVTRADDRRMPHWRARDLWRCEAGTPGHETPATLRPLGGEPVVHKTDYSAFAGTALASTLRALDVGGVVIAGTHLHACVRATALDAYHQRLDVVLADDAVASDDPLHAAATRAWLAPRGIRFRSVADLLAEPRAAPSADELPTTIAGDDGHAAPDAARIVHVPPAAIDRVAWTVAIGGSRDVERAVGAARRAQPAWNATPTVERAALIERLAAVVAARADALAAAIVADVGKPVGQAHDEVARTIALLRAVAARGGDDGETSCGPESSSRRRPLGVVALVTPWNNPLAIPLGKLAPALVYGNTVVWKPAPAGTAVAVATMRVLAEAGLPPGAVALVAGDAATAIAVMEHGDVDAVALTGNAAAGYAAQAVCARRRVPLQAELGGNNPALVAADADLAAAAQAIVAGAFDFAGQRCTANRRAIVDVRVLAELERALADTVARYVWGRPDDPTVGAGPVVSVDARARIETAVTRALDGGASMRCRASAWPGMDEGAYTPPVVLRCDDPRGEIVQEETFGPVLVVQPARDWSDAIRLANDVRQGLVAAAFTTSPAAEAEFLAGVRAGILKLGASTAGADVDAPFGGWKHSGVGPPEHGAANRELYTRAQAVYRPRGLR